MLAVPNGSTSRASSERLRTVDVRLWSERPPALPFAVLDVETTGLSGTRDRIIEIAVVRCDTSGSIIDEWETLVDPGRDPGPTHIHGISAADLADAPTFADIAPELVDLLDGHMICAHNLSFDASFLFNEFDRTSVAQPTGPALCTLELAREVLRDSGQRAFSLAACAATFGIPHPDAHRALADTRVTAQVLAAMLAILHPDDPQGSLFD